jgi:hypothetical protein
VVGVEQGRLQTRVGPLSLRVGAWDFTVRCMFLEAPRAPFMLGRADFLDRLMLTIDPVRRRIVLTECP